MTTIRCYACRVFFTKAEPECPKCGAPRRRFNAGLVSQQWQSALNAKATTAND